MKQEAPSKMEEIIEAARVVAKHGMHILNGSRQTYHYAGCPQQGVASPVCFYKTRPAGWVGMGSCLWEEIERLHALLGGEPEEPESDIPPGHQEVCLIVADVSLRVVVPIDASPQIIVNALNEEDARPCEFFVKSDGSVSFTPHEIRAISAEEPKK